VSAAFELRRVPRALLAALAMLAAHAIGAPVAHAQTTLGGVLLSTDITTPYGALTISPRDVAQDGFGGNVALAVSGLPASLATYHRDPDGARLLVFATTVALPGGVTATPRDVVRWDGSSYALLLQGAALGVPGGAAIDVVTRDTNGKLVLAFDVDVALGGNTFARTDLVEYDGAGPTFTRFFDGVGAGLDPALAIDAADVLPNGRLLLSLDGYGSLAGGTLPFGPADVLEVGQDGSNWHMSYQTSGEHSEVGAANVDVVQALTRVPGLPFDDGFENGSAGAWTWRNP